MCHDIATDRFLLITGIRACCSVRIWHDLIRYDDSNTELGAYCEWSEPRRTWPDIPHQLNAGVSWGTYPDDFGELKVLHDRWNQYDIEPYMNQQLINKIYANLSRERIPKNQVYAHLDSDMRALAIARSWSWWSAL